MDLIGFMPVIYIEWQALGDGRMTDGQGRTVDFKNTVIVMTSSRN